MRIDLCLGRLCLYKTRSQAARACDDGLVQVNGRAARPSREVRPGDLVAFQDKWGRFRTEVEILELPGASVSKAAAREFYRMLAHEKLAEPWPEDAGE